MTDEERLIWEGGVAKGTLLWSIEDERGGFRLSIRERHAPSWHFDTRAEAEAYAQRIEDSAPVHKDADSRVGWWPCVVIEGPETRPVDPQPGEPPEEVRLCRRCGSSATPVLMKPIKYTLDWWDDPLSYWNCPDCNHMRSDPLNRQPGYRRAMEPRYAERRLFRRGDL